MAFPGPLSPLYTAVGKPDGPASDDPFWDDIFFGTASTLVVDDEQLKTTTVDNGANVNGTHSDILWFFRFGNTTGGPLGIYFRVQSPGSSSWTGYWLVAEGLNWALKKRPVAGGGSDVTLDSVTVDSSLSQGVFVRAFEDTLEVYRYEGNTASQTPILSASDSTFSSGAAAITLPTGWLLSYIQQADASLEAPDGPFTLYVDADHPDASDSYTRLEASDPDTPLATPMAAAFLAYATPDWGDTIQVEVAENANPVDPREDTSVYGIMDHKLNTRDDYPAGWPFGDNTDNEPITVKGNMVGAQRPRIRGLDFIGLTNWEFEDIQFGYDEGSGNDHSTTSIWSRPKDLTFRNCLWTGRAAEIFYTSGEILLEDCSIRAPLAPSGGGSNDGRGFSHSYAAIDDLGGENSGNLTWRGCDFRNIRGNDAIQVTMGGYEADPAWGTFTVEECTFYDVLEGSVQFHTDAIQILGGPEFVIRRNTFIGCSTPIIASDFHNGTIAIDANLIVGGGALITIQGTDDLRIRNNTILGNGPQANTALFLVDRTSGVTTLGDLRNNIITNIFMGGRGMSTWFAEGTVIENNIVLMNPGGVTPWGTHMAGLPEFGTSDRLDDIPTSFDMPVLPDPLPANYELANTPVDSPGIGDGQAITGDPYFPAVDLMGRAWASPPDVGCLQSDPGTIVAPVARPPYLLSRSPAANATGVDSAVDVTATFYPRPGQELEAGTVTGASVYVTDPAGTHIPAVITVSELDEDGQQTVTVDLVYDTSPLVEGALYPLVTYTANLTAGIEDTEGSAIAATSWSFRVAGPVGPAIGDPGSGRARLTSIVASERNTEQILLTLNSAALDMDISAMKTLRRTLDRLLLETSGNESDDATPPTVQIGPLT